MRIAQQLQDKYCVVYCGPEHCNCKRGHGYSDDFSNTLPDPPKEHQMTDELKDGIPKITREELAALFGSEMPIEVAMFVTCTDKPLIDVRKEVYKCALGARPLPAPAEDVGRLVEELRFFADARFNLRPAEFRESKPVGESGAKHLVGTLYEAATALSSAEERETKLKEALKNLADAAEQRDARTPYSGDSALMIAIRRARAAIEE